jgi:hypothetical protein
MKSIPSLGKSVKSSRVSPKAANVQRSNPGKDVALEIHARIAQLSREAESLYYGIGRP